jgi:peptide deformylase
LPDVPRQHERPEDSPKPGNIHYPTTVVGQTNLLRADQQNQGDTVSALTIIEFPDPRLRTVAQPVERFDDELKQFVDDMYETMYSANGVGLAATQVNVHKRVLVADMSEGRDEPLVLINPEILEKDGEQVYQEGCLSFPGAYADVTRALRVKVRAQDVTGKEFILDVEGPLAVCIQHEMDHLLGKVFVDYLSPLKRTMLLKRLEKSRRQSASA